MIHNSESVMENKKHKLLRDFKKQTGHLISARQTDLLIFN